MDIEKKLAQVLPIDLYGKGEAKDWDHLIGEIRSGETKIEWSSDGKPIRVISLVFLEIVAPDGRRLIEAYQEFSDGRRRERGHEGIGEKLHPDEKPLPGAIRALKEELGFSDDEISQVKILRVYGGYYELRPTTPDPSQFFERSIEERESPSYPGLTTRYVKYSASIFLPESLIREEYVEYTEDGSKTVFRWR